MLLNGAEVQGIEGYALVSWQYFAIFCMFGLGLCKSLCIACYSRVFSEYRMLQSYTWTELLSGLVKLTAYLRQSYMYTVSDSASALWVLNKYVDTDHQSVVNSVLVDSAVSDVHNRHETCSL